MISGIYTTLIYQPLYNGLVLLIDTIPWADAGVVVIIFTIIVKLFLFPLSKKAVKTQIQMKAIEPELAALKERYKNDKQELARKQMDLYKERGIRPFVSVLLIFIQIPIIIALYRVFLHSGLPKINTDLLYSFIHVPDFVSMIFLNFIDISQKSPSLALLVGITTFLQSKIVMPNKPKNSNLDGKISIKEEFAKNMHLQMRYFLPVILTFVAFGFPAVVSLYWVTSNLFTIGQELFLKRVRKNTTLVS
ncbi:MAG: YidC/Oxa1 family membrane protein insertase [Candidatus Paceibacterota bacterium]